MLQVKLVYREEELGTAWKEDFKNCLSQTYPSIQEVIDHAFES